MNVFIWGGFILLILILLALDLGVFHRKNKEIKTKEAVIWTIIWIVISLIFNVFIYYLYENNLFGFAGEMQGKEAALNFFTGYLIEKSLSVDNIFVIAMIFAYFSVPLKYQHRLLFWGILGALILRAIMIIVGAALMEKFFWISYVFGALLLFSAIKMLTARHDSVEPYKNPVVKLFKRFYPVSDDFADGKFFTRIDGKKAASLLFIVLLIVETTDVMFAIDSIPAIFAVTTDSFIVFSSNVFAILGLRSLYFVLASVMDKFRYLKISLVFVLAFIGVKMILLHHFKIPIQVSLSIIAGILFIGIGASIWAGKRDTAKLKSPLNKETE